MRVIVVDDDRISAELLEQSIRQIVGDNAKYNIYTDPVLTDGHRMPHKINVRCFGKFEVFKGEYPIKFSRTKAKELLAYLIAARGSSVTSGELCGVLWDDATDLERKKTYLRQYASSLRAGLEAVDAKEVFIHNRDSYSVNIALINCDYYSYLRGNTMTVKYTGEFMSQYSWAEEIGAQLQ